MNHSSTVSALLASTLLSGAPVQLAWAHPPDETGHHSHEPHADPGSLRNWTNVKTGEVVRGSFLAARDGKISIERANGDVVVFELADLSDADRAEAEKHIAEIRAINERLAAGGAVQADKARPGAPAPGVSGRPDQAAPFDAFAPFVKTRWDDHFLYVESDGLPHAPVAHPMMVGITAWQQQVPLPQTYTGDNAWRIPLKPEIAATTVSAKEQLFRGAIALAANGVPIFNPIKNDGKTDTFLAGELDEFGGHCGRGDDYHYHIAPLALQKILGHDKPVAYALDGFPIYGYFDPAAKEGDDKRCPLASTEALDELNGHYAPAPAGSAPGTKGLYHYHASVAYPYLNGGMRGKVTVKDDQIDPQPRATSPREALPPLKGAKITGFARDDDKKTMTVEYALKGKTHSVKYVINADGSVVFTFTDGEGKSTTETYATREKAGRGERRPPREDGRPPRDGERRPRRGEPRGPRDEPRAPRTAGFTLTSSAVADGGALPAEYNGDGEGATLPLAWSGAPDGTKSYALIMDHTDRDGVIKTYWTVYDIPADVTGLPKNMRGIGKLGATWKRGEAYVTPHSAGNGVFTYTLHLYALSAPPEFDAAEGKVTREALLAKIKETTLGTTDLRVTYSRPADAASDEGARKPKKESPK